MGLFECKATLNIVLVHINTFDIAISEYLLCVPSSIIAVLPTQVYRGLYHHKY